MLWYIHKCVCVLVYLQQKQDSGQMYDSIIQIFTRTKKTRPCLTRHPVYKPIDFNLSFMRKIKSDLAILLRVEGSYPFPLRIRWRTWPSGHNCIWTRCALFFSGLFDFRTDILEPYKIGLSIKLQALQMKTEQILSKCRLRIVFLKREEPKINMFMGYLLFQILMNIILFDDSTKHHRK